MRAPFFRKRLKVRDAMTTELARVSPKATLQQAAKKMYEYRVGNVLVVEDNSLKGIITEMDIVRKAVAKNKSPQTKVEEVMATPVIFVSPDDEILHISDKMLMNNITRLPVVDLEKREIVGIITMKDVLRVLPNFLLDRIDWLRVHPGGEAKTRQVKGICEVCGKFTNNLKFSNGLWVCEECR